MQERAEAPRTEAGTEPAVVPAGCAVGGLPALALSLQRSAGNRATAAALAGRRSLQREVRVTGIAKGSSAGGRRQELVDRLNRLSPAIRYRLEGSSLHYEVLDRASLTPFDREMKGFIDRADSVPMRLIDRHGLVQGQAGRYEPLLVDSWVLAYVDLDDLMASSDTSFQLALIHLLTERFATRSYARMEGMDRPKEEFDVAHRAGTTAETAYLRALLRDPTLEFEDQQRRDGGYVLRFRSQKGGYRVLHTFKPREAGVMAGDVTVVDHDGRASSVADWLTRDEMLCREQAPEALGRKTRCYTPMPIAGPDFRDTFGVLAHLFIAYDYATRMGVTHKTDVFFDDSFAGGIDPDYADFLIRKNPALPAAGRKYLRETELKRPDAVLHQGERREIEEIKPDNEKGHKAGAEKLAAVDRYMRKLGLPYLRGSSYNPPAEIDFFPPGTIHVGGVPLEVTLKVRRHANGLIVYQYCFTTDFAKIAWRVVVGVVLFALLLLLKRLRLPFPVPILPPPNPIPSPITPPPIPVPAKMSTSGA